MQDAGILRKVKAPHDKLLKLRVNSYSASHDN